MTTPRLGGGAATPIAAALLAAAGVAAPPTFEVAPLDDDAVPRYFHAASPLADGRIMITGGLGLVIFPPSLFSRDDVAFLDPDTGAVTTAFLPTGGGGPTAPTLAVPRSQHRQTTLLDGRVLVTGGRTGATGTNPGTPIDCVSIFDPADGTIVEIASMVAARAEHVAVRLGDGRVLVAGGAGAGGGAFEIFDPAGDGFERAQALLHPRRAAAAVLLADFPAPDLERVALIGGGGSGGATIEIVDPAGGSTLAAATLPVARDDLAAARLPDGTLLIVGGQDLATGDTLADAFRWDPVADVIAPVAAPPGLPLGVADHGLVALGRWVLLAGGESQQAGNDVELDRLALFDAARNAWTRSGATAHPHDDAAAIAVGAREIVVIDGGVRLLGQEAPSAQIERVAVAGLIPADADDDGSVGFSDLVLLLGAWGRCPAPCPADVDGDGAVALDDLLALLAAWSPGS